MSTILALSIGNTRIQLGRIIDGKVEDVTFVENDETGKIIEQFGKWWGEDEDDEGRSVMLASVQKELGEKMRSLITDQFGAEVYEMETDVPVPIGRDLEPETIVGIDRLLDAAAAWDQLKQACVVIDAGTAITVDFIDGEGVFHGGAILPGAQMQLEAMGRGTDLLDAVNFSPPQGDAFGRNTTEAMLRGVYHGIRGGVWRIIETFSEAYGAYPLVLATGGNAEELFADDELITRVVPDLAIRGIAVATRHATAMEDEEQS